MNIQDVRDFVPGQRQLSAGALNAMLDAAQQFSRENPMPGLQNLDMMIEAQTAIASGAAGAVKRCYWDGASFGTQGAEITALNIGPSTIPINGRAFLRGCAGATPVFSYTAVGLSFNDSENPADLGTADPGDDAFPARRDHVHSGSGAGQTFHALDPEYPDTDFTIDESWHDKDLSGDVGSEAVAVLLAISQDADVSNWRADGQAGDGANMGSALGASRGTIVVPCLAGVIEYQIGMTATSVGLRCLGYWA